MEKSIILEFKPEAYSFLRDTLEKHRSFIRMLGVNGLIKDELTKDISKIKITLDNAKKGDL